MLALSQDDMFNYAALDSETRIVVQQRTTEIKALMKRAASDIVEIGQKLIDVKVRLGHGHFGGWLKSEFGMTDRTARNFMQVAETFKSETVSDLIAVRAMYLLSSPTTPETARAEALERAALGETITHSAAKEIVQQHKNPDAVPFDDYAFESEPLTPYEELMADNYESRMVNSWDKAPAIEVIQMPTYAPISERENYSGDDWKTPAAWIETARALMGCIDTDPASNDKAQELINATTYYTKDTNGLDKPWHGKVWLNPPYSQPLIGEFTEKLVCEYDSGNIDEALYLVNNCTDTAWFISLAERFPVMFGRGRISFWYDNPEDKTPTRQGQALFYLGERVQEFYAAFSSLAYAPNGGK